MTPRARELTLRGVLLGIALTFVFTAANIYLGLKVGLTFSTSIPAAVLSMAALRLFKGSNIRENNIVQTVCSAAGAMASIIFVLPGLVIVGWWTGFPFATSFLLCAAGGILGVLFTIPLRRALVTTSDLPYPEGVAGAEVLRVGSRDHAAGPEAREGVTALVAGSLASAGLALIAAARLVADSIGVFFRLGAARASGFSFSFSLALLGAGHLVGIAVGASMLLGMVIAWGVALPALTGMTPQDGAPLGDFVTAVWRTQVRYIGAGAIAAAAMWSLGRMLGPILSGLKQVMTAPAATADGDHSDRDIPFRAIVFLTVACTAILGALIWHFLQGTPLAAEAARLALLFVPIILIGGFLTAAVCGYMAGLIGSSNSPVSGVGILAAVGCAACLVAITAVTADNTQALVALALFVTSILFAGAVSSNDNLQDLKTGQLVGAAPWRQQIALIIGVIAASLIVPFILNLLARAYGFAGAPNLDTVTAAPLPAPQANLIGALAQGVVGGNLDWNLIGVGALAGLGIVALDEIMRVRGWLRIPPLAAGLGIYLPMGVSTPIVLGALLGALYDKVVKTERGRRAGVLVASGLIVGESLFGVVNAGLIVALNRDAPLAVIGEYAMAPVVGLIVFAALVAAIYAWLLRRNTGKIA